MKIKFLTLFLLAILILPNLFAIDLDVKKISDNEAMVISPNIPATFVLEITNNGNSDEFVINNLLGFIMEPSETFKIKRGETKTIEVKVFPREEMNYRGFYSLPYLIRDQYDEKYEGELEFKIVDLKDVFEIGSSELDPESNTIIFYIRNKENLEFSQVNAVFSSAFFEIEKDFSFAPRERKIFTVELNKEDFDELTSGFYTLEASLTVDNVNEKVSGKINFVEKEIVDESEESYGFIINTNIITKENKGNTVTHVSTSVQRNIISRLFTTFSSAPDSVQRDGFNIYYTWERDLRPGESLNVRVDTNWLIPLIIVLLIVAIIVMVKRIKRTGLELSKSVSFVKAKGGEFALKVTVNIRAKKYVENVQLIERLPPLVKVYEKFLGERPSKVDERLKKIEWNLGNLEGGEIRSVSYIIYSKIGILGKFALPSATAIFESNGKVEEAQSNKAFFVAEQITRKDEE